MFSLCTIFTTLWLLPISSFTMSLCVFVAMTGKILCEIHRSRKYVRRLGFFEMKDNGENWFGVFWFTVVFCLWMNALCAELQSQSKAKTAKCRAGFDHIFNDRAMIIWSRSFKYSWLCLEMPSKNGIMAWKSEKIRPQTMEYAGYLFKGF